MTVNRQFSGGAKEERRGSGWEKFIFTAVLLSGSEVRLLEKCASASCGFKFNIRRYKEMPTRNPFRKVVRISCGELANEIAWFHSVCPKHSSREKAQRQKRTRFRCITRRLRIGRFAGASEVSFCFQVLLPPGSSCFDGRDSPELEEIAGQHSAYSSEVIPDKVGTLDMLAFKRGGMAITLVLPATAGLPFGKLKACDK